jgi:hypothetical protein
VDWTLFAIGFVMGAATTLMGFIGAAIYEAGKLPPKPLWEVFDRDGTYIP